jgi:hypothetical protein
MQEVSMRNVLLVVILFLFTGCAIHQPPRYGFGLYVNPEHNYKIEIPVGWDQLTEKPSWMPEKSLSHLLKNSNFALSNNSNQGAIFIYNHKSNFDFQRVPKNKFKEVWKQTMLDMSETLKEKIYKTLMCSNYHYDLVSSEIPAAPNLIFAVEFMCGSQAKGLMFNLKTYAYTCDTDNTCFVYFFLISTVDGFEQNKASLTTIANSILTLH